MLEEVKLINQQKLAIKIAVISSHDPLGRSASKLFLNLSGLHVSRCRFSVLWRCLFFF